MTEEMSEALAEMYFCDINARVLPGVDYEQLSKSYTTEDKTYAKSVLNALHAAFVKRYGSEYATEENCGGFVTVPAVIRARNTGELCIGMVSLDLMSSCEHWATYFFTEMGVLEQGHEQLAALKERVDSFIPYDYWYTVKTTNDIHMSRRNMPEEVKNMIEEARIIQPPKKAKKPRQHER